MRFGIALGSNLGDRRGLLCEAVAQLLATAPSAQLTAVAPLYETSPVDCPEDSPPFYNSVVELECDLDALALLRKLRVIEADLGRPSTYPHHAPRTVDLDMLYADALTLHHPDLTLPHPRWHLRRFVLQPLADIRPDLVLPGQTRSVAELLRGLTSAEPPLKVVAQDWLPFAK